MEISYASVVLQARNARDFIGNDEKGESMKEYTLEFLSEEFARHIEQLKEEDENRSKAEALKVIVDAIIELKKEKV